MSQLFSTIRKSTLYLIITLLIVLPLPAFAQQTNEPLTSLRCNEFTFDATGSYDLDNENITYSWDFGDGIISNEAAITHVYDKSGDYMVTLTITDNAGHQCSTATTSQKVRVNIPPYASFSAPDMACANQPVSLDASGSYDDSKNQLGYQWDFGDGTKAFGEQLVSKVYTKGGTYSATLTVNDNSGTVCNTQTTEKLIQVNEPPIADAGEEVILKCINDGEALTISFDATNSKDVNNDQLTYIWDFGDATKAEGQRVTHTYQSVGNYDVKLIVKDGTNIGCGTSVDFITVKLNLAPKANAGEDVFICQGEDVIFDGTNSFVNVKGTSSAKWFFGDGQTVEGLKATHRYAKAGQYQASLTVENKLNEMCPPGRDTKLVTVNSEPSVTITSTESACIGNRIHFDASSATDPDGDSLEFYWSFGDGSILKAGPKVSHEYMQGGSYKVTVIVDDAKETSCSTATATTTVRINTPPVADAGPNLSCCVGKDTLFDASASSDPDGDALVYSWDFGDGTQANGAKITHTYSKSGAYTVLLTVDDNSGTTCSKSTAGFIAEVNSSPVPIINIR